MNVKKKALGVCPACETPGEMDDLRSDYIRFHCPKCATEWEDFMNSKGYIVTYGADTFDKETLCELRRRIGRAINAMNDSWRFFTDAYKELTVIQKLLDPKMHVYEEDESK